MSFEPGAPGPEGFIPLCVPEIRGNEWAYVKQCLDSGWVSSVGAFVTRFESEIARRVGVRHAIATVNGTAALHVALQVAGVGADDEVLVSTLTFIAPVNAIRYLGAWPLFVDAEPRYWQMDAAKVRAFLAGCRREGGQWRNPATGRRVAAILPVDVLGHPVDIDPIADVAREHGLPIVEDATEALGATYRGRPAGQLGTLGALSFNGNKILTTGGGGMVLTDDDRLAERARYLTTQAKDDPVEYVHGAVGYNYRLPNIQAAMGCAQLELLDDYVAAKRRVAARYAEGLAGRPGLQLMPAAEWVESTYWLYTLLVDEREAGLDSRALLRKLADARIQARPLWQPGHRSPAHADAPPAECPVADDLHRRALSLPSSVGLSAADQDRILQTIRAATRA